MKKANWRCIALALAAAACADALGGSAPVHHELTLRVEPSQHRIEARDTITFEAQGRRELSFSLHRGMNPRIVAGARFEHVPSAAPGGLFERYRLALEPDARQVTIAYGGEILHRVEERGEEYARSFGESPGIVSNDGVFLAASSHWYPRFENESLSFRLEVTLPAGWGSVSQGKREARNEDGGTTREIWRENQPQEEIYLVAGRFEEYRQAVGTAKAMVFLRKADAALAQKYLDATGRYLKMYEQLIGPYPYAKFALVENFWETGYGMPSFTLLGSKVIRLPFILESSYPHEILHNWWGNGVYVDYENGNWSEGLTSYLADHLLKEQRGQGAEHRRATLQKYTDYVRGEKDFPLTEFRGRHSAVTEAVGYGKTLMLFHMLRQKLGDAEFAAGLQRLYRDRQFKVTSFDDVRAAFESAADCPLGGFFDQWVTRSGAPRLQLEEVKVSEANGRFKVTGTLKQTQAGPPYPLRVPIAVQLDGVERVWQNHVEMTGATQDFELTVPARPRRVAVDPEFDVFRRLHREEIPPALSQVLGADRVTVVLPATAPEPLRRAYKELAQSWAGARSAAIEVRTDAEMTRLPEDRAVWLFGWENRFRRELAGVLDGYAYRDAGARVEVAGQELLADKHSAVVVARHPANPDLALALVAAHDAAAVPGLGRKLPHYGKYSFLGFSGNEPENILKGQWPVLGSPLTVTLDRRVAAAEWKLAPRPALIELPAAFSLQRMQDDIAHLAAPEREGRGLGSVGLDAAAEYIVQRFAQAGLKPGGDQGSFFQAWSAPVPGLGEGVRMRNVIGVLPGRNPALASVVVSAHYDHLGKGWPDAHAGDKGKMHPGADDNASGVAVMLELARALAGKTPPERSIVFAAFTGEEAGRLGSMRYVQTANKAMAVVNLDTVGRLGVRELLVLGAGSAREWPHIFRGVGFATGVTIKTVADDFGSSDQRSFIDAGMPGVQLFTGPHEDYHRPGDTADKVDGAGLLKAAGVLKEAVEYLANRAESLNTLLEPGAQPNAPATDAKRKVTLGTVPDFAHGGDGVRLSGVTPDTPAAAAGLRGGDVIVRINEREVRNLRDYGEVLRALAPGGKVTVHFRRDGAVMTVTTSVIAR